MQFLNVTNSTGGREAVNPQRITHISGSDRRPGGSIIYFSGENRLIVQESLDVLLERLAAIETPAPRRREAIVIDGIV